MSYTDLAFEQDDDGLFDLIIEDGDFKLAEGLETALLVSLFSDRRAYFDEVPDPLKRRGCIIDLVAEEPGDKYGSGLWFYEQSRLSTEVRNGIKNEAEMSLQWTVTDKLATFVQADAIRKPADRSLALNITLTALNGGVTCHAFKIADATRRGALVR